MKILLTSVGSFSGPYVIDALSASGHHVLGTDINPISVLPSIDKLGSFYQVPHSQDADAYLCRLREIIRQEAVDAVIALTDPEVDLLAARGGFFGDTGVVMLMPRSHQVSLVRDKLRMSQHMTEGGLLTIPTAETLDSSVGNFGFPMIAKLRTGRSSIGLRRLNSEDDISPSLKVEGRYIFQPHLDGDVITVDIVSDPDAGNFCYMPRLEHIRTANGAGMTVEVFEDESLTSTVNRLCALSKLRGCFNVEFIRNNDGYHLMDINPRFSAGIGFSLCAGYDFVNNHIACFTGNSIEKLNVCRTGIYFRRIYEIAPLAMLRGASLILVNHENSFGA